VDGGGGGAVVVVGVGVVVLVVGSGVGVVVKPHRYVTPHCPSPLKHCHGLSNAGSHGVHRPQPAET